MGFNGITDGKDRANVGSNGGLDVNVQDSTTPSVIIPFSQTTNSTTLGADTVVNAYTITVSDTTGFTDGKFITICDPSINRYWIGYQVGAPVGNVITVDRPLDAIYTNTCKIIAGITNMNVDGSLTTEVFSIREADGNVPTKFDITRLIITIYATSAVDLNKFGNLAELTNGITIRRVDGETRNILNWKSNGDIAASCYDITFYTASNPVQAVDGVCARITFAHSSKMGSVIRIGSGEDIEILINDDLSTLTKFFVMAEGHEVEDN